MKDGRLYNELSLHNIFIYSRNLLFLIYDKICLILYVVWGLASSEGLASSPLRYLVISDHLRFGSRLKLV